MCDLPVEFHRNICKPRYCATISVRFPTSPVITSSALTPMTLLSTRFIAVRFDLHDTRHVSSFFLSGSPQVLYSSRSVACRQCTLNSSFSPLPLCMPAISYLSFCAFTCRDDALPHRFVVSCLRTVRPTIGCQHRRRDPQIGTFCAYPCAPVSNS